MDIFLQSFPRDSDIFTARFNRAPRRFKSLCRNASGFLKLTADGCGVLLDQLSLNGCLMDDRRLKSGHVLLAICLRRALVIKNLRLTSKQLFFSPRKLVLDFSNRL